MFVFAFFTLYLKVFPSYTVGGAVVILCIFTLLNTASDLRSLLEISSSFFLKAEPNPTCFFPYW